jgi:hypothetical protein
MSLIAVGATVFLGMVWVLAIQAHHRRSRRHESVSATRRAGSSAWRYPFEARF